MLINPGRKGALKKRKMEKKELLTLDRMNMFLLPHAKENANWSDLKKQCLKQKRKLVGGRKGKPRTGLKLALNLKIIFLLEGLNFDFEPELFSQLNCQA